MNPDERARAIIRQMAENTKRQLREQGIDPDAEVAFRPIRGMDKDELQAILAKIQAGIGEIPRPRGSA